MENFLAIDPGKSGAYAIIDRKFQILKLEAFAGFLPIYRDIQAFDIFGAVIEDVRILGIGASSQSSTTFMKNAGGLEAILQCLLIRHKLVAPKEWQAKAGCNLAKPVCKSPDKKVRDAANRAHRKNLKEKSVEVAAKFYGLDPASIDEHKADALNMARIAIQIFG